MPIIGALIGGGASLLGGLFSGNAAKEGAEAQARAMMYAAQLQHEQYLQNMKLEMPFMNYGKSAINPLSALLGLSGPAAQQAALANYQNSPYFKQMQANANTALNNGFAAKGVSGGNLLDALYKNNASMWNQDYQQHVGNLQNAVGTGLNATNALSNVGTQLAQSQGQLMAGAGAAQGAGIMGYGNALGNAINNVGIWSMLGGGMNNNNAANTSGYLGPGNGYIYDFA